MAAVGNWVPRNANERGLSVAQPAWKSYFRIMHADTAPNPKRASCWNDLAGFSALRRISGFMQDSASTVRYKDPFCGSQRTQAQAPMWWDPTHIGGMAGLSELIAFRIWYCGLWPHNLGYWGREWDTEFSTAP